MLKIGHLNIHSVRRQTWNSKKVIDNKINVLLISETKLDNYTEADSQPCQTAKMECFLKVLNDF